MEGTPFGPYRLINLLGRGGMGEVWRAYDTVTDRIVALKVLAAHFAADRTFQQRFRREAHSAARLNNPHVVPIHTYGEIDGRLFVDMRLIDGRDLATVLASGAMAPSRAVHIVEQVAHAVYAAHKIGLVHRDIKPSNILLDENDFAYLIDFGIARVLGETGLTGTDAVVGTLRYMAPERFRVGQADARSDIYALACVLYECLTGGAPFPGDSIEQQLAGHLSEPPPRPSDCGAPPAFDAVIATGMAKDPAQRYATPVDMARAARDAITVPLHRPDPSVESHPASATAPTQVDSFPSEPTQQAHTPLHPDPPQKTAGNRNRANRSRIVAGAVIAVVVVLGGASLYLLRTHTSTTGSTQTTGSAPAAPPPSAPSGGATPSAGVTAVPSGPPTIATSVRVGNGAFGVAVDAETHTVYVANTGSNSVSLVDTASRKVTATVAVGLHPVGVAVDPSTRTVYVTNFDDSSVSVIDTANGTVIARIGVGSHPGGIAVDPDARIAYATNGDNASVSVIDTTTHTVTGTVPTGKGPSRVAIDRTAHRLFVTTADPTVTVIDTTNRTVIGSVALRVHPAGIAIDSASHTAYIASGDDASVSFVDTISLGVTASVPVGQRPAGVAVDPPTNTAYVANYSGASVSVVDTTRRIVTGILAVGNNPLAIAVDPTTHFAYVTSDLNHGSLTVIER
ncbi:serine/threonine-protein kinase [Mycobacterium sp. Aquia_213]|uniref:serine/threonine-protein kinase n=1 Tax=Mycobacterium sp. Aquia_213 TaxID=2991728 RepID=UPI0022714226|nr:serine/threonine-protein kinase [Mycobacterium sp. Aquia_213]WAC93855.1 serine/threonine-protein kinase [Mycobacterium sp. Aquia_213]